MSKKDPSTHDSAGETPEVLDLEPGAGDASPDTGTTTNPGADLPPVEKPNPEIDALNDRLLRLQADFDNFRRRSLRERDAWTLRANEGLLLELLPVIDHFELGLKTAADHLTEDSVQQGFALVYEQLKAAVKKFGVEVIEAEGQPFDPHVHEAITHQPSDEVPADTVLTVFRKGYRLGEKLLRPAQVVVSSGSAES